MPRYNFNAVSPTYEDDLKDLAGIGVTPAYQQQEVDEMDMLIEAIVRLEKGGLYNANLIRGMNILNSTTPTHSYSRPTKKALRDLLLHLHIGKPISIAFVGTRLENRAEVNKVYNIVNNIFTGNGAGQVGADNLLRYKVMKKTIVDILTNGEAAYLTPGEIPIPAAAGAAPKPAAGAAPAPAAEIKVNVRRARPGGL